MPAKGVVDALTNSYTDVAKMMLLPDAQQHMTFLQGLQQGIMQYIQMSANATLGGGPSGAQAGMGGPGGGMGAGPGSQGAMPPGAGPGGPAMGAAPGAGGPPGTPTGGAMQIAPGGGGGMSGLMTQPNPDDLRRLLAAGPAGSPG